jgi:preprotein translocase subunit SecG
MIYGVLLFLYILVVVLMIGVILVQQPRGGGLSGALGGTGMENILGVRGAPTFFQKLTAILGGIFIVLSLILSLLHAPAQLKGGSAIEKEVKKAPFEIPPLPAETGEENK